MMDEMISEILNQVPSVIEKVSSVLPQGFPEEVALPIFEGIKKTAERLE